MAAVTIASCFGAIGAIQLECICFGTELVERYVITDSTQLGVDNGYARKRT